MRKINHIKNENVDILEPDIGKEMNTDDTEPAVKSEEPEDGADIAIDTSEAIVQSIDGVIIQGDDEEVKMMFYYYEPDSYDEDSDVIRCKGIVEFRASRSNFLSIVKTINKRYYQNKKIHRKDRKQSNNKTMSMFS